MKKAKIFTITTMAVLGLSFMPQTNILNSNVQVGAIEAHAASTIEVNSKSSKTLKQALASAKSGDTVVVNGTIKSEEVTIPKGVKLVGKNKGKIDFSKTKSGKRGITVTADNVTIQDLEICNAKDNGIYITGNKNTLKNLKVYSNGDTGVQLSDGASYNTLTDIYSHHNVDASNKGENADGFAIKLHSGAGNVLTRCIAEYNSDDGYDCYATHGAITFIDCQANYNGNCNGVKGDGNGFKLGGVDNKTPGTKAHLDPNNHILTGCSAKGNTGSGFDRNNQNGVVTMTKCTASGNKKANFNWPKTGKPSALGYKVTFGVAKIIDCTSSNGKNDISGAKLSGNCKGF